MSSPWARANVLVGQDPASAHGFAGASTRFTMPISIPESIWSTPGSMAGSNPSTELRAGADPGDIQVEYSEDLSIDAEGRLHAGNLIEAAPEIFQDAASGRVTVAGRYVASNARTAGFEVDACDRDASAGDRSRHLLCNLHGRLGAGSRDGVALDSSGNLYAVGWTEALNFPIVVAEQAANAGGRGYLCGEGESLRIRTDLCNLHWRTRRRSGRCDRGGFQRRSVRDRSDQLLQIFQW